MWVLGVLIALVLGTACDPGEKDPREVHTVQLHTDKVTSVTFSADGRILATASHDDTIRMLDVSEFLKDFESTDDVVALPSELGSSPIYGFGRGFGAVAFSPDATHVAGGNYRPSIGGVVQLYEVETGDSVSTKLGHDSRVRAVAYNPAGDLLASGDGEDLAIGEGNLWRVDEDEFLAGFGKTVGGVRDVAFSPDGETVASASGSDGVGLWSAEDGKLIEHLTPGRTKSLAIAFSPDGTLVASCGDDGGESYISAPGIVRIWTLGSSEPPRSFDLSSMPLHTIAFSPDGRYLAAAGERGLIYMIKIVDEDTTDTDSDSEDVTFVTMKGHVGTVNSIAFSSTGKIIASGGDDRMVRLWYVGDLYDDDTDPDGGDDAGDEDAGDGDAGGLDSGAIDGGLDSGTMDGGADEDAGTDTDSDTDSDTSTPDGGDPDGGDDGGMTDAG